jgi:hydrogenase maturation protease
MNRALVLACGNALRGDDGVGLHIVSCLRNGLCDPDTHIQFDQQWTPELAEPISKADLVIFLDASASVATGEIACHRLHPIFKSPANFTHQTSPATLLSLAEELYGSHPPRAFLLTVGGTFFDLAEGLSEPVRRAVPRAIEHIKALLSGACLPEYWSP